MTSEFSPLSAPAKVHHNTLEAVLTEEAIRRGEAPMLVRFEGAYAATTLTVMGDRSGFVWQDPPAFNKIDELTAAKWKRKRRVIIKAEVVCHPGRPPKNNPRFVVTNLPYTPQHVYEIYRARGDVENRLKELKAGLALDRLSCSRFSHHHSRASP